MTILCIDDSQEYQASLRKLLEKISEGGVTLYSAFSLEEGLRLCKEKNPAVILLDLVLPDSPTWQETLSRVKEFKSPVIIVTAMDINQNNFEIFVACMKAGARRVFQKPAMLRIWEWLGEKPRESFAARLLGTAGTLHLESLYGRQ